MTDAPETIWATAGMADAMDGVWEDGLTIKDKKHIPGFCGWSFEGIKYRRADLPPKVKPLEWISFGDAAFVANTPFMIKLRVESFHETSWYVTWSVPGYSDEYLSGTLNTSDEAKAAAQAEYDRRILSALEV